MDSLLETVSIVWKKYRIRLFERFDKASELIQSTVRHAGGRRPDGSPNFAVDATHAGEAMVVEERAGRVVICVNGISGREARALAHSGTGGILIHPVDIEI